MCFTWKWFTTRGWKKGQNCGNCDNVRSTITLQTLENYTEIQ